MSYIGSIPTTAAFPFDQFSGNNSTTAFTLTYAPAGTTSILVSVSGVTQNPNTYSIIGTTLTFTGAPPTGTNNIAVLYLGLPVIGVSSPGNTAYRTPQDFTATASQTTFTTAGSYTVGFVDVYRNGARLGVADFTATTGTTVVLASACTAGDLVTIVYFTLTSIVNALPQSGGTITGSLVVNKTLGLSGSTSGTTTLTASAIAGTNTITLPAVTGTAALTSDVIGVGQTWQNLTGSRVVGTTYTNTTGKAIQLLVELYYGADSNQRTGSFIVAGIIVCSYQVQSNVTGQMNYPTSIIVPAGSTYQFTTPGSISILSWAELR